MSALVTLTTDFGPGSCYVAAVKGVLFGINPQLTLLDLTHRVPPQNLQYTSYFLQACVPYFPASTLHVVVVDPGVGSERAVLHVELGGQRLLVPDNGCWTGLMDSLGPPSRVIQVTERRYWRAEVSNTFHGRDIFAPVAAHLSLGLDPAQLGPPAQQWVHLPLPRPTLTDEALAGEVVFVDDFGNLLTNIPGATFRRWEARPVHITVGATTVHQRVRTYAEAERDQPVALVSSLDTVEIAINHGSAARTLGVGVGTPVHILPHDVPVR
jgi:S-adenosylmethionine hydrolase